MKIEFSQITSIEFDSRKVQSGSLFVAVRGTLTDGHNYIQSAVNNGARVVVCEELPEVQNSEVQYIAVKDSHRALSKLAAEFYDFPSKKLKIVGITGTNGKTTTATLLYELFTLLGYRCGLLSTVENRIAGEEIYASTHTTPDAVELNALLRKMVDGECTHCFMEVSSHSLVQRRVDDIEFTGGVFTNLTHDHLDYHGTFAEYLSAKKSFFDNLPKEAFALTNVDDRNGMVMLQNCDAAFRSYSLRTLSNYRCRVVESHPDGMELRINDTEVWVQLLGRFNAYNLTAIYGVAIELGENSQEVLSAISALRSTQGRFQSVRNREGKLAIVDYAHTPDALKNVLETLHDICPKGNIITVVGCGGDRDKSKRPIMAQIATELSSRAILTSDNPRSEDPKEILNDMVAGLSADLLSKTLIIEDRAQAIKTASALATNDDIILIAGKGHEKYQEINNTKIDFDDLEVFATQ